MSNVIVLGAGMVGSTMAIDMAKNHNVTLTDLSQEVLNKVKLFLCLGILTKLTTNKSVEYVRARH